MEEKTMETTSKFESILAFNFKLAPNRQECIATIRTDIQGSGVGYFYQARPQPVHSARNKIAKQEKELKLFNNVKSHISDNIDDNINLDELATKAGLSKFYFCRRFKEITGMSPYHYLIHCRMDKAKKLLKSSNLSITDIAFDTGYDNLSNFIRTFKKMVNITPKQYRKQWIKNQ